jgi:hypothetical protein
MKKKRTDYSKPNKKKKIVKMKRKRMKKGVVQYLIKSKDVDEGMGTYKKPRVCL